jgi:hypothetical protein
MRQRLMGSGDTMSATALASLSFDNESAVARPNARDDGSSSRNACAGGGAAAAAGGESWLARASALESRARSSALSGCALGVGAGDAGGAVDDSGGTGDGETASAGRAACSGGRERGRSGTAIQMPTAAAVAASGTSQPNPDGRHHGRAGAVSGVVRTRAASIA